MSIGLEIIIYILLIIGTFSIAITFFDKEVIAKNYYIRKKDKDSYVKVILKIKGVNNDDISDLKEILQKGKYDNIYDIADSFCVINKSNWQKTNILIKYAKKRGIKMFAYFKGVVLKKSKEKIVLDVRDIGFEIYMPEGDIDSLKVGDTIQINVYTEIKEGYIGIFGFLDESSRSVFEKLKKVSGIGPKSALQILSNMTPDEICISIANEDSTILKQVPGIGAKTAARIILELKDKVLKEGNTNSKATNTNKTSIEVNEAALALKVLGYTSQQIDLAIKGIDVTGLKVNEIIKKVLSNIR